jgi:hypothetical protein
MNMMKSGTLVVAAMACLLSACVSRQEQPTPRYSTIRPMPEGVPYDPIQDPDACHRLQEPFSDLREIFLPPSVIYRAKTEQKIITVYMRDARTPWGYEKASWATNFAGVSSGFQTDDG